MQTSWPGLGLVPMNMVLEEVFRTMSQRIALQDTPNTLTLVNLPVGIQGVKLYTTDATIWYALDEPPGPVPPDTAVISLPNVPSTVFVPGDILHSNTLVGIAVPDDFGAHTLQLISAAMSPVVEVTFLLPIGTP